MIVPALMIGPFMGATALALCREFSRSTAYARHRKLVWSVKVCAIVLLATIVVRISLLSRFPIQLSP